MIKLSSRHILHMNIKVVINRLSNTLTKALANTVQRCTICQPFLV